MALDPSIILGNKPLDLMSADDRAMNAAKIQNANTDNQINQYKIADYLKSKQDSNNLQTLLQANPGINSQDYLNKTGDLVGAKTLADQEKLQAENSSTQFKTGNDKLISYRTGLGAISTSANPKQDATTFINDNVKFGIMTPEHAQSLLGQMDGKTDDEIRQGATMLHKQALTAEQQMPKNSIVNLGGTQQPISQDAVTGAVTNTGAALPVTMTPEQISTNQRQNATSAETNRHNLATENEAAPTLTDAALDSAARTYRMTGQIPALGQGKSAAILRSNIINRAGELDTSENVSGDQPSINRITGKANAGAINQLQKQYVITSAFEKNANANADMALNLSAKVDRTGVPVVNTWLQAGQKSIQGNADVSAFNAANETFVNEYAKIMSGSMGNTAVSDSARNHAHDMLSTSQTPEQYKAVVNTLKQEMGNRMDGFRGQLTETQGSFSTKPNANTDKTSADKTVTRTGMHNGKKVIQYSDGSISYAQ